MAALAIVLGMSNVAAHADDNPTPGATIVADPNSPTGYTGHFVYYDPTATSIRFDADILMRDWNNPSDPTVYQPSQYRPGLMRGGGAYDVQMTNVGNGYWVTDVPLSAGANQYWFYRNNDTNNWLIDPTNAPVYAPDGLTGSARRAFNKIYVPYDPVKQNYAPLAARQIENYRPDAPHGTWSYVPITIAGAAHTIGVYLPPGYDPNRAQPYKTIYLLHGSGQDQSDWLNMGDAPTIMDNELQDGTTQPAVIVTTNQNYLGSSAQGFPNIESTIIPFVQSHYNVSTDRMDRAWAGLSMGAQSTITIINNNPLRFGYYGVWSFGAAIRTTTPNLKSALIDIGCGVWDSLNLCPTTSALTALNGKANYKFNLVAGGHDFNTWDQQLALFLKNYVWQPRAAFVNGAPVFATGGESQTVTEGQNLTFGVAATDPDGDALAYSASNLPTGATFDAATQQFSWTPGYTQAGSYTVTFTASDGTASYNLSATKTVTITVGNVFQVSAAASVRCVAGKGQVYVTATNADPSTVDLSMVSTYDSASFAGIATGKSATHSFTTRQVSVPAGTVTVTASAVVNGAPASTQVTASYPATACG